MEVAKSSSIPLETSHYHDLQSHQQLIARIDVLHDALKTEIEYTRKFLEQIHAYNARPLALDENNKTDTIRANISQKRSQPLPTTSQTTIIPHDHDSNPLSQSQHSPMPTPLKSCKCCQQRLASEERELRNLEKKVRGLEGRVKGFEEMPPDKEKALLEVEKMKRQLDGLMSKRNRLFKDLVKESASGGLG